jgi:hypothetical protein
MSSLFDLTVYWFLAMMRAPSMAFVGCAVLGVGAARLLPAGSLLRAVLLGVAVVVSLAAGLGLAAQIIGGSLWHGSVQLR